MPHCLQILRRAARRGALLPLLLLTAPAASDGEVGRYVMAASASIFLHEPGGDREQYAHLDERGVDIGRGFNREVEAWDTMLDRHIRPAVEAPVETELGQALDTQPAPLQPTPGPTSIVGVWQGRTLDMFGQAPAVQMVFQPDGRFSQLFHGQSGAVMRVWGRYSADGDAIEFAVAGWEPQQWCGPLGCAPVSLPLHERVPFQLLDANSLQTSSGVFSRVQ